MRSDLGYKQTEIESLCLKITKQEEAENDKYRILNKFSFNHFTFQSLSINKKMLKMKNNNYNNNIQSEKSFKKIVKDGQTLTQQTTAIASTSSLIKINNKKDSMYPIDEKVSTNTFSKSKKISIQSKCDLDRDSSDIQTEKERNEQMLMKNIHLKSKKQIQESLSKLSKNSSFGENENSKEMNEEENSSKTNYIIDAISIKERNNEDTEQNEFKNEFSNIFRIPDTNMYNISLRIVNDEYNENYPNHHKPPKNNSNYSNCISKKKIYCFIAEINKTNEGLFPIIKQKDFFISLIQQMNSESLYYLLFHSFDMFNIYLLICKDIRKRILSMLNDKFSNVIKMFKLQYSAILKVQKISFKSKTYYKLNKPYPIFDLVISSEIITNEVDKCYDLSYEYYNTINPNHTKYLYTWKFDIRNKTQYGLWFTSELENYNQSLKHYCYTQPISSYSKGDIIQLHLNIFSCNKKINPSKIKFFPLTSVFCPQATYEKMDLLQKDVSFDYLRSCEIERIVHLWKNISNLKKKTFVSTIVDLFKNNFDIINIQYDVSQLYYIRYKMKAKTTGILKRNRFFSFDIQIVNSNDQIENETQCLGILNMNCFQSKYMIRVGTKVSFYCIEI